MEYFIEDAPGRRSVAHVGKSELHVDNVRSFRIDFSRCVIQREISEIE
jgi:hypothetical protein